MYCLNCTIIILEYATSDGILDLDEANLHNFMSYMTSNIPSSLDWIALKFLLLALDRFLFLMVLLLPM